MGSCMQEVWGVSGAKLRGRVQMFCIHGLAMIEAMALLKMIFLEAVKHATFE